MWGITMPWAYPFKIHEGIGDTPSDIPPSECWHHRSITEHSNSQYEPRQNYCSKSRGRLDRRRVDIHAPEFSSFLPFIGCQRLAYLQLLSVRSDSPTVSVQ